MMRGRMSRPASSARVGLVLSGGGMRGAYEVGVIAGMVDVLGLRPQEPAPFGFFAGTSVGAINATYMAANAHCGDLAIDKLIDVWEGLKLTSHVRMHPWGLVPALRRRPPADESEYLGQSLLDPRPLELTIRRSVDWDRLHANISGSIAQALFVAALDVGTGRTTIFSELAPGTDFRPSRDPRRRASYGRISADHVLASAAIPLLFPARRIGMTYYCDGGLRFNTPIAPVIRAGADRLVVISTRTESELAPRSEPVPLDQYPSLTFLAGKILNALLLDPMAYDLQVLTRTNSLVEVLERTLSPEDLALVQRRLVETRGAPYSRLDTLVFSPSQDIGQRAAEHVRQHLPLWNLGRVPKWILGRASHEEATWEADWATYLLFDGAFGKAIIDLGRHDAHARADEIREFFKHAPAE